MTAIEVSMVRILTAKKKIQRLFVNEGISFIVCVANTGSNTDRKVPVLIIVLSVSFVCLFGMFVHRRHFKLEFNHEHDWKWNYCRFKNEIVGRFMGRLEKDRNFWRRLHGCLVYFSLRLFTLFFTHYFFLKREKKQQKHHK
jgi:hypothetical protein